MSDERRVPITLRMPRGLLDNLKAQADLRSHSMNAEIVQRLEESIYLSHSAHALEGADITDAERAVVQSMRNMNDTQRRALVILVNSLSSSEEN